MSRFLNHFKTGTTICFGLMFCLFSFCLSANEYLKGEFLLWKIKDSPAPIVLITQGDEAVLGDERIDHSWRPGGKVSYGSDSICSCFDGYVEVVYGYYGHHIYKKRVAANGLPGSVDLILPYYDVSIPGENSETITVNTGPSPYSGEASLKVNNRLQGAELNAVFPFACAAIPTHFIFGFRYLNYREDLTFRTSTPFLDQPSSVFMTQDKFDIRNHFYGLQIGFDLNYHYCAFEMDLTAKTAVGAMSKTAKINGYTDTNEYAGQTSVERFEGGYFALPTNIGTHHKTVLSSVSELNFSLGYEMTSCLNVMVGYGFIYATDITWATKVPDRVINTTQVLGFQFAEFVPPAVLVGEAAPKAKLKSDSFWAHGLNIGIKMAF